MRLKNARFAALVLGATVFALSACSGQDAAEDTAPSEQGGNVSGDVLGGSISDDMLPLDAVQSQSPPAKRAPQAED